MKRRQSCLPGILLVVLLVAIVFAALGYIPTLAEQTFGPPSHNLSAGQHLSYALDLLWNSGDLTVPVDPTGSERNFSIDPGEAADSVATRLQQTGLIRSAASFRSFLIWSGIDTGLQPGTYRLSPALTAVEIGSMLRSAGLTEVTFVVLPGWRMEEIAATLPTSGLPISPEQFLAAARQPASQPFFLFPQRSAEGFLFPDQYLLSRTTTADQLVSRLLQGFGSHLTPELRSGFTAHGLSISQAVTLASIVQKETVVEDEMPLIASVFYNRLSAGMPLETDPTVQYALGYNAAQGTWWTNPLSLDDLKFPSPYNTYLNPGLPPGPISNPGLAALTAVADPAQTNYLYFRARCDGSGRHQFSETFEQHLLNACP